MTTQKTTDTQSTSSTVLNPPPLIELTRDVEFSVNGRLYLPLDGREGIAAGVFPTTNNRLWVTYYETALVEPDARCLARIIRLDYDGKIDTSYGNQGTGYVDISFAERGISAIQGLHENNGLFIWGESLIHKNPSDDKPYLLKLMPNGQPDQTFGNDGLVDLSALLNVDIAAGKIKAIQNIQIGPIRLFNKSGCAASPLGGIIVGVRIGNLGEECFLVSITPEGRVNRTFQDQGWLRIEPMISSPVIDGVFISNRRLAVCGQGFINSLASSFIVEYEPDGEKVTNFGNNGVLTLAPSGTFPHIIGLSDVAAPTPHFLAYGESHSNSGFIEMTIQALTMSGDKYINFNGGQPVLTSFGESESPQWTTAKSELLPSSSVLVSGQVSPGSTRSRFVMVRFLPNGQLDNNFAANGQAFGTIQDLYTSGSPQNGFFQTSADSVVIVGSLDADPVVAAIKPAH